jgi:hypothetical protein
MQRMKSKGVLVSTDGPRRNVVKMKPPLCFTMRDADTLVAAMDFSLRELSMQRQEHVAVSSKQQQMLASTEVDTLVAKLKVQEERIAALEAKLEAGAVHSDACLLCTRKRPSQIKWPTKSGAPRPTSPRVF